MALVAGIDSSTQSTKVVLCDADDGHVVAEAKAPHPDGTECHPDQWWRALGDAGRDLLGRASAIAVAGQQHGMVVCDDTGEVVRPALLWNDVRSAPQAHRLVAELGAREWADRTGSVPTASFTVTKLAWLAECEPESAARAETVMLPHDWLTWRLRGDAGPAHTATTDRSDASGTGYWDPSGGEYRPELVKLALGRSCAVPRVAGPAEVVGTTADGALVAAGAGDNAAAALGLAAEDGDVVVSIGTSGTVFAVTTTVSGDPTGQVAGFADATGRRLPLVCTLNAARVLDRFAALLGATPAEFDDLALSASPGAAGLILLPYLDGERTPNRPGATGVMTGLTGSSVTRGNLARAAVEGVLCGLADGMDRLVAQGVHPRRLVLIGGGAASRAVRQCAAEVFGIPVTVPDAGEYVARGAARQAAWALSGRDTPPDWPKPAGRVYRAPEVPDIRQRYAGLRSETVNWEAHT